jgi:hypothetical protein
LAALALLSVLAGCGSSASTHHQAVVASVTGCGSVTRAELGRWTKAELTIENHAEPGRAARAALNLLIGWVCLSSEAHRDRLAVSVAETKIKISLSRETAKENLPIEWFPDERAIRPFLESPRISRDDLIMLVKMAIMRARIQSRETTLLEPQVMRSAIMHYYRQHPSAFESAERRDVRAIMNRSRAKDLEARRDMQAGVPFRLIERRFNQTKEGGLHIGQGRGKQAVPWERDYFSAPAHVLIGPRKEVFYYVFEVLHIYRPHVRPLSEVEAKIRHLLAQSQASSNAKAREAGLRSRVTCLSGYVGGRCGRYASSVAS